MWALARTTRPLGHAAGRQSGRGRRVPRPHPTVRVMALSFVSMEDDGDDDDNKKKIETQPEYYLYKGPTPKAVSRLNRVFAMRIVSGDDIKRMICAKWDRPLRVSVDDGPIIVVEREEWRGDAGAYDADMQRVADVINSHVSATLFEVEIAAADADVLPFFVSLVSQAKKTRLS